MRAIICNLSPHEGSAEVNGRTWRWRLLWCRTTSAAAMQKYPTNGQAPP